MQLLSPHQRGRDDLSGSFPNPRFQQIALSQQMRTSRSQIQGRLKMTRTSKGQGRRLVLFLRLNLSPNEQLELSSSFPLNDVHPTMSDSPSSRVGSPAVGASSSSSNSAKYNNSPHEAQRLQVRPPDSPFLLPFRAQPPSPSDLRLFSPPHVQLERLLKDPSKPVSIPGAPKEKSIRAPREMMKNVQGSSAGAGSGEFHVYKQNRRREYERLKLMDEKAARVSSMSFFRGRRVGIGREGRRGGEGGRLSSSLSFPAPLMSPPRSSSSLESSSIASL